MVFLEIAICTLIVSFGPYISELYFLLTILILVGIIAVMEMIKRRGFIKSFREHRLLKARDSRLQVKETTRKISTLHNVSSAEANKPKLNHFTKVQEVGVAVTRFRKKGRRFVEYEYSKKTHNA